MLISSPLPIFIHVGWDIQQIHVHVHLYICTVYVYIHCIHTHSLLNTESYAPFQCMALRESFLTVGGHVAAAPGPAHYTPTEELHVKGGDSLQSKVLLFMYMYVKYSDLHTQNSNSNEMCRLLHVHCTCTSYACMCTCAK